jgi:hypothetical protein
VWPVVHLDAGYDYQPCRQVLAARAMAGEIAARGVPAPIQVGRRWVIERTHAWGNQYGKLRWCTERRRTVVEFWLALANAAIVCGRLVRRTWTCYRLGGPTPPPPVITYWRRLLLHLGIATACGLTIDASPEADGRHTDLGRTRPMMANTGIAATTADRGSCCADGPGRGRCAVPGERPGGRPPARR